MFKSHQLEAINVSIENDFKSGIHFHATGTGKTWIALQLALEFEKRNPQCNILWICEQKSILQEQFSKIKHKKNFIYDNIYKTFLIYNFCDKKDPKWYLTVNNSSFWKKPSLIVINRSYLTSQNKYELLKIPIDLIIHDECHSIKNKTTRKFYDWALSKFSNLKCLGFSATPCTDYKPFETLLSKFSIYQGFQSDIILPPKIIWYKSDNILNLNDIADLIKSQIKDLPYKKILVWCGIIEDCFKISEIWKTYFPDFKVVVDTSIHENESISDFYKLEERGFLFCASKHKEGSDIPNLDCCIFLDKVEDRGPKTFIQCIGRVLRKDLLNKKKYGLVLDLKATCCMDIINRIHPFLFLEKKIFPWKHSSFPYKKNIIIHQLDMLKESCLLNAKDKEDIRDYSVDEIKGLFVRSIELKDLRYHERLEMELELFYSKKLLQYLVRAVDILELTKGIPHVTRGSCGSSLVCYLLGISHIDPIKYNITFSRFLNEYRNNLPDIDFDFPYNCRKDVFLNIEEKYPGKMARISNHIYYQERSALREAVRTVGGIKKQIPKFKLLKTINTMSPNLKKKVIEKQKLLKNTFRTYSLHCGGIIYYPDGIPSEKVLDERKGSVLKQVILNKENVSDEKRFKIDILSSRSLAIINSILGSNINFEEPILDPNVFQMLSLGDNIGITLAESPLMRKTLITIKPKSIEDLAICLAIIRPAAQKARKDINDETRGKHFIFDDETRSKHFVFDDETRSKHFVFDDDAIINIANILDCPEAEADKIRRIFAKNDTKSIKEFLKKLEDNKVIPEKDKDELIESLYDLSQYSFCKAHAFSYAQLIYQLAYLKYHKPLEFWKAALKHSQSSYKNWVHRYEAKISGLDYSLTKEISIYAENRRKKINSIVNPYEQMKVFGYWKMDSDEFYPDCYLTRIGRNEYNIKGLIASSKSFQDENNREAEEKQTNISIFLGVGTKVYVEVKVNNLDYIFEKSIGCVFENALLQKKYNDFFYVFNATNYKFF